jgi:hypothetical protein
VSLLGDDSPVGGRVIVFMGLLSSPFALHYLGVKMPIEGFKEFSNHPVFFNVEPCNFFSLSF